MTLIWCTFFILTPQGHISKANANADWLTDSGTNITSRASCDAKACYQEEMRVSPRLSQHASGVILGVSQIINGLEDQVNSSIIIVNLICLLTSFQQRIVKEVAMKFASSHFVRGVKHVRNAYLERAPFCQNIRVTDIVREVQKPDLCKTLSHMKWGMGHI